ATPVDDAEIVREFLVESGENLDRLDRELVILEQTPGDSEILASIFRTIHTLKGTSGFLQFTALESLAHVGENLLSRLRDGQLSLNPEITNELLAMVDAIREILASIETNGAEGTRNDRELIARLMRLYTTPTPVPAESLAAANPQPIEEDEDEAPSPPPRLGDLLIQKGMARPNQIADALEKQEQGDPRHLGEILIEQNVVKPHEILEVLQVQQTAKTPGAGDATIRVDVHILDKLMNLVGELVLTRNQILQRFDAIESCGLLPAAQRLNLLTGELQEGVMKTRMQPIGNIWSKFPRTARDVAVNCGKQVRIEMEGKEIELDKTILEAIKDPLTHLLRNAVDHGIETPEARQAAGKNPEGRIYLHAFHEGGQVNIEISDDGGGLNVEKLRQKAVQKGVVTAERGALLSEREIFNLIFLPGFSTAEKVTNVSGRGVGMDVVKTNVEKIGGTVDIQSRPGAGTTVRMKIPLTLAIVPALIVTCAGDRYAIPQVNLLELVRIEPEQVKNAIENVHGAPVYRRRGNLLPLVYLDKELEVESPRNGASGSAAESAATEPAAGVSIVVLRAEEQQFGLVVDEVNDAEEIVVKPLSRNLKSVSAYSGATIMGDGRVALILDVLGLAHRSRVLSKSHDRIMKEATEETDKQPVQTETLLLFADESASRMAIPLARASRLEEFPRAAVEEVGGKEVVQYRGEIMPLIHIGDVIQDRRKNPRGVDDVPIMQRDFVQVVVFASDGRNLGLVIGKVLDIVMQDVGAFSAASREGVRGCAVIQLKVTELIDLEFIAQHGLHDAAASRQPVNATSEV
ncbi:MAG: chemotaxis protein CheA, partial [Candidatus Acidiferrales bacterium]